MLKYRLDIFCSDVPIFATHPKLGQSPVTLLSNIGNFCNFLSCLRVYLILQESIVTFDSNDCLIRRARRQRNFLKKTEFILSKPHCSLTTRLMPILSVAQYPLKDVFGLFYWNEDEGPFLCVPQIGIVGHRYHSQAVKHYTALASWAKI